MLQVLLKERCEARFVLSAPPFHSPASLPGQDYYKSGVRIAKWRTQLEAAV